MPADVRVRTETPMLGLAWGEEVTLTRSPLVEAAIAEGRLTVVSSAGEEQPLKGAALDAALEAADLPTSGTAADKRARLAEHRAAEAAAAAGPGPVEIPAPVADPAPTARG